MICLDTQVTIWAVQKPPPKNSEELVERTAKLLARINKQGLHIALPAIVVAEYLAAFPEEQIHEQLALINSQFIVLPFDSLTSVFAVPLLRGSVQFQARTEGASPRYVARTDAMVVAIARRHKARAIA